MVDRRWIPARAGAEGLSALAPVVACGGEVREIISTHFQLDEHGNYICQHEGWQVRIWDWTNQIDVSTPEVSGETHELEVYDDFLYVMGESWGQWAPSSSSVRIPWPVVEAILAARSIVDARKLKQQVCS